jgi:schlafen family protein
LREAGLALSTVLEVIRHGEQKDLHVASQGVTHAALKTIAAFLNTEGGDLLIGVADDRSIVGIEPDSLDNDDKFMRHLAQVVRNGLGDRASTCIDPKTQIVKGKTICLVSCQRSPEPVFLKWKSMEGQPVGAEFQGPSVTANAQPVVFYWSVGVTGPITGYSEANRPARVSPGQLNEREQALP